MSYLSLPPWLLFLFILDTGGWIGLRPVVIALLFLISVIRLKLAINLKPIFAWIILIILMIPSIIAGESVGVSLNDAVPYIYPILVFPFCYYIAVNAKITQDHFISAGTLFSVFVSIMFIGSQIGIAPIVNLLDSLSNNPDAGFFKEKSTFFDMAIQGIYFKATLLLIPLGVLAAGKKRWWAVFLMLIALIIAQSKTGVFVLAVFAILAVKKKSQFSIASLLAISISIAIFSAIIVTTEALSADLALGLTTRSLHLYSIYEAEISSLSNFLTGFGAGSSFYSYGFMDYTADSEVSQLEILRRYGIFFLVALCVFFYIAYKKMASNDEKPWAISLLSYFVVSASNPVLLTAPAALYYAVMAANLKKQNTRK